MTKEQIQTYTRRVSQANVSALAVVVYDMTIDYLEEGIQSYKEDSMEAFETSMRQAQAALQQLMGMSKAETQTGLDVMQLYFFIDRQILMTIVKRKPENIEACIGYLKRLRESFQVLSEQDKDAPLMERSQQVYAGLTYGKGYLNETRDPLEESKRGLQA